MRFRWRLRTSRYQMYFPVVILKADSYQAFTNRLYFGLPAGTYRIAPCQLIGLRRNTPQIHFAKATVIAIYSGVLGIKTTLGGLTFVVSAYRNGLPDEVELKARRST